MKTQQSATPVVSPAVYTREPVSEADRLALALPNPAARVQLNIELTEIEAWELAQFVKRVGWSEFRGCAVDDSEAYLIRIAVYRLQVALGNAGFAPR